MSWSVSALKAWLMESRDDVLGSVVEVETVFRDELATEAAVCEVEEREACSGDCESGDG